MELLYLYNNPLAIMTALATQLSRIPLGGSLSICNVTCMMMDRMIKQKEKKLLLNIVNRLVYVTIYSGALPLGSENYTLVLEH